MIYGYPKIILLQSQVELPTNTIEKPTATSTFNMILKMRVGGR
jgi:hypothetical protein